MSVYKFQFSRRKLSVLISSTIFLFYFIPVFIKSVLGFLAYGYAGYDAGVYYQGVYKISRFEGLFNTIRGTWLFGDHGFYISFLIAPFLWIYNSLSTLLFLQTLSLAGSIFVLWHICDYYKLRTLPTIAVCLAWALNPAIVNMNLENFHPETLGVILVLLGWDCWIRGVKRGFWLFMILAMLCKEDYPVVLFFLGPFLFLVEKKRKEGVIFSLLCISWYFLHTKIFWALGNGLVPFSIDLPEIPSHWFSEFWSNKFNPTYYYETITQQNKLHYLFQLLSPLAFLVILGWEFFAIALVPVMINILGNGYYQNSINYHYNYLSSAFLFLALILAFRRIKWTTPSNFMAMVVILASTVANINWSLLPIGSQISMIKQSHNTIKTSPAIRERNQILEQTPAEINVSVSPFLAAAFSARNIATTFPNPWIGEYWGQWFQENRFLLSPAEIDRIILNRDVLKNDENRWLVSQLFQSKYFKFNENFEHVIVLDKVNIKDNINGYEVLSETSSEIHHGLSYLVNNYRVTNYLGENLEFGTPVTINGFLYLKPDMNLRVPSDLGFELEAKYRVRQNAGLIITPLIEEDGLYAFSIKMNILKHPSRFLTLEYTQAGNEDSWKVFPEQWLFPASNPDFLDMARKSADSLAKPFPKTGNPIMSLTDDTFSLVTWKRSSWDSVAGGSEWGFEDNIFHLKNTKDADQKIVKLVTIKPGQALKFEAEIKTDNVRGGNAGAFVCILDTYWDSEKIRGTTDWQLVELVIVNDTSEEKQIPFCLRLGHYGALVSGEAWFRNVTVYPTQIKQWDKIKYIHRLK